MQRRRGLSGGLSRPLSLGGGAGGSSGASGSGTSRRDGGSTRAPRRAGGAAGGSAHGCVVGGSGEPFDVGELDVIQTQPNGGLSAVIIANGCDASANAAPHRPPLATSIIRMVKF